MNNIKNELIACLKYGWIFWVTLLYGSTLSPIVETYLLLSNLGAMTLHAFFIHAILFILLLICSIHYWLIKDAKEYNIELGWVIKIFGIILPFITIPYYIFKRRKQKSILIAVTNFFLLYCLIIIIELFFNYSIVIMTNGSIVRL